MSFVPSFLDGVVGWTLGAVISNTAGCREVLLVQKLQASHPDAENARDQGEI